MSLIPDTLQHAASSLALPPAEILNDLFRSELLLPWLRRQLLETLANHAPSDPSAAAASTEDQLTQIAGSLGLTSLEDLDHWCQSKAIPLTTLQAVSSFHPRLQAATESIWGQAVAGRFLERRSRLDQVTLSVLRFDDADLAQELYFQLVEGETTFPTLIECYSHQSGQPPRGLIGPVSLEQLHPLLARVAERYEPGEIIPPLDLNGQVHLLRVEAINKASLDEEMRQRMLVELRQQWLEEQLRKALERLAGETMTEAAAASN